MKTPISEPGNGLSEAARRRRIAELLNRAVNLAETKRAVQLPFGGANFSGIPSQGLVSGNSDKNRILNYLRITGQGSPVSIRSALGLSRSAAYRALLRLIAEKRIYSNGKSCALVYRLCEREAESLPVAPMNPRTTNEVRSVAVNRPNPGARGVRYGV